MRPSASWPGGRQKWIACNSPAILWSLPLMLCIIKSSSNLYAQRWPSSVGRHTTCKGACISDYIDDLSKLANAGRNDAQVLLAHTRRWKHDSRFFKMLRKHFRVTDITSEIDEGASTYASNSMGRARLFKLSPINFSPEPAGSQKS